MRATGGGPLCLELSETMLERALDAAHKLVASGLLLGAVGGFGFCAFGCYDLVTKARLHRRLRAEAASTETKQS